MAANCSSRQVAGVSYRPYIRRAKLKFKKAAIDYIRMTSSNHPRYVCTVLSRARFHLRDFACFVISRLTAATYHAVVHGCKYARAATRTDPQIRTAFARRATTPVLVGLYAAEGRPHGSVPVPRRVRRIACGMRAPRIQLQIRIRTLIFNFAQVA